MQKNYRDAQDQTTGSAKFTAEDVRNYRRKYDQGLVTVRGIAKMHGMSGEAVRRMLRGETWAWVKTGVDVPEEEMVERIAASQEKLLAMLKDQGLAHQAGFARQEELGITIPEAVLRQAEALTGRTVDGKDIGDGAEPLGTVDV